MLKIACACLVAALLPATTLAQEGTPEPREQRDQMRGEGPRRGPDESRQRRPDGPRAERGRPDQGEWRRDDDDFGPRSRGPGPGWNDSGRERRGPRAEAFGPPPGWRPRPDMMRRFGPERGPQWRDGERGLPPRPREQGRFDRGPGPFRGDEEFGGRGPDFGGRERGPREFGPREFGPRDFGGRDRGPRDFERRAPGTRFDDGPPGGRAEQWGPGRSDDQHKAHKHKKHHKKHGKSHGPGPEGPDGGRRSSPPAPAGDMPRRPRGGAESRSDGVAPMAPSDAA